MQILLTTLNAKYIHTNLAIRILYQLNKAYDGLAWKEFTINEEQEPVATYCAQYDVVCFSCYIWNITQTLQVAQQIKHNNPNTKILLGGPEVSYEYNDVIALDYIDYIIIGEGEIPFQQFIQTFPNIETVEGLVFKQNGKIIENKTPAMFDLMNFADVMPYADDDINVLRTKVLYLETSRGCPYKCEFCLASLDNKVRYLPNESIKRTLMFMMQHGKVIKFLDRTFNIKKDFTIDIFQFILDHHSPKNIFQFEITADIIHPDIIEFIQEKVPVGLFRFEIGIQTVNQKANLAVSRKQNFDKTKSIIKCLDNKIEMHLDLIVGLALDYFDDIKYSFEEVFKLFAPELQLGFLKFLKGTPVRDKHNQHGFVFDKNPPYQIIESNYLSKEELNKIVLLEHALEIYWNKGRTVQTLKYITNKYSIFDFLLGVGGYFSTVKSLHQYTLRDVYKIIYQYADEHYNDPIILDLIAIDYHLQHKIKPQSLFINELERTQKFELLHTFNLDHTKFRYMALPIHFNYFKFVETQQIELLENNIIIQYNGTSKPIAINTLLANTGVEASSY
ncbi:MAG: DUF4080 domain-containing protein [Chitinophagales bacterium]